MRRSPALAGGKTPKAALPRGDLQILGKSRGAAEGSASGKRKKDPVAVETFRKTFCDKLHEKRIPLEASVHLWGIDEMRFGLQPVTRWVWTLARVEVVVPVCPRYQWGFVWGALEIGGRGGAHFSTPTVSARSSVVSFSSKLRPVMRRRITSGFRTEPVFTYLRCMSDCQKK